MLASAASVAAAFSSSFCGVWLQLSKVYFVTSPPGVWFQLSKALVLSRARPSWRVADNALCDDTTPYPYRTITARPSTALLSRSSRRSRSMHIPRTLHFSIAYSVCMPYSHMLWPRPLRAHRARGSFAACTAYPPSSLRGCAAPWDSVCACPFLRARAFPRFCFRVHSGLYYDGSAFCRPAPYREAAHVTTYRARRHPRRRHPRRLPQSAPFRLRTSRGRPASPFSLLPRGFALRTSTSGTSPSSWGTCCC